MTKLKPYQLIYEDDKYFLNYLKNGIIVDSGVLLEFIKWIVIKEKGCKIEEEEIDFFKQIENFLSIPCKKYFTPHILAELSNLINSRIEKCGGKRFSNYIDKIREELKEDKENNKEYYELPIKKEEVIDLKEANRFGITDSGIIVLSKRNKSIILTSDEPFSEECKKNQDLPTLHLKDLKSLYLTLKMFKK